MPQKQVYEFFLEKYPILLQGRYYSYFVQVKTKIKFFYGFQARHAISNLINIG
jgi:hypothetical protein